jgi:hypothetical protein
MRLAHIFWYYIPGSTFYLLFFSYYLNTSSTRTRSWFHDVHVFKVCHSSICLPSFVVFRKNVSHGCYVKKRTIQSSITDYISPHRIFTPHTPTTCEMIDLLEFINIFYPVSFEVASPKYIPIWTCWILETCDFQWVYHAVISMCTIYFESKLHTWFYLILLKLNNFCFILGKRPLNFKKLGIRKIYIGFSSRKLAMNQCHNLVWWLLKESLTCFSFWFVLLVKYYLLLILIRHLD